jgi:hypothetical protein
MIGKILMDNSTACLSLADISQMIAGAQSATIANAGAAMMVFFGAGCIVGGIIVYLIMRVRCNKCLKE